jgi:hypothetical protein
MKLTGAIFICLMVLMGILWLGAAANGPTKKCVEWETVYPTPTPIPMSHVYSEWIPIPGTSPGTGHGWIRATELAAAKRVWPPREILTAHILTDAEYNIIAEEYGMALTQGGRWTYGFAPISNFPLLYGGVTLKNEWLPKRLQ